ncbi:hypothetical protein HY620_03435 [Candidatus Uhrbacteria bacterium]|nr:hypothetical protein [Candidatus Uhrbacteria bacterium]
MPLEIALTIYQTCPRLFAVSDEKENLADKILQTTPFFLSSPENVEYMNKLLDEYKPDELKGIMQYIVSGTISRSFALHIPKKFPLLLSSPARDFVCENADVLLNDSENFDLVYRMMQRDSAKAESIIQGYFNCLQDGFPKEKREVIFEFTSHFKIVSLQLLKGYVGSDVEKKMYIERLKMITERMISGTLTDTDRAEPYFNGLLYHVYPNNVGHWTTLERNKKCSDRSADLAEFNIEKVYRIDLLAAGDISLAPGASLRKEAIASLQHPVWNLETKARELAYDVEALKVQFEQKLDEQMARLRASGRYDESQIAVTTIEEKLFLLMADEVYGTSDFSDGVLKSLLLEYEFIYFEDIQHYIAGTRDRVSQSKDGEYILLCELHELYAGKMKEIQRTIVERALQQPATAELLPFFYNKEVQEKGKIEQQTAVAKLQVEKLGLSEGFLRHIKRTLGRGDKQYSDEQLKKLIRRYERAANGLQSKTVSEKTKKRTKAFYGQLRAQREATMKAVSQILGGKMNAEEYYLDTISLGDYAKMEHRGTEGEYNQEEFAAYTTQRFMDVFAPERDTIAGELDKYVSTKGSKREVLNAYIGKDKESAHARMVGGVCVSGDNPPAPKNLWDMPNYFQMVFQDTETFECRGLVLLHHFEEDGKKILTASLNPSSTYLYSVDGAALFEGIMKSLEQFAMANDFDMIAVSQNHGIRTNRTKTIFEASLDERIKKVDKQYSFQQEVQFSYSPNYQMKGMDIVWSKK